MNLFKKYFQYFPHLLLSIFVFTSLIRGFNLSEAIALFALCGLSGYLLFLESRKQVDYSALFKQEIDASKQEVESIKQELNDVKTDVGQLGFNAKRVVHEKVRF